MPSNDPQSFIIKSDSLGVVGNFDPTVLARIPGGKNSSHVGQLFLRATLDETMKIRHLSKILDENNRDLLQETDTKLYDLEEQKKELDSLEQRYDKRRWIFKLFRRPPPNLKLARRRFVSDTLELWNSISTKSDTMKREYLITPTADLTAVESESVQRDQPISGLVLDLPKGPVTQEAVALAQEIMATLAAGNPFADPSPSDSQVGQPSTASAVAEAGASSFAQSSSPSSRSSASSTSIFGPTSVNVTIVNNTNSTTSGIAVSNACGNGGSALSGDHPSVPPS